SPPTRPEKLAFHARHNKCEAPRAGDFVSGTTRGKTREKGKEFGTMNKEGRVEVRRGIIRGKWRSYHQLTSHRRTIRQSAATFFRKAATSHTRLVVSVAQVARRVSSGENESARTVPRWPESVPRCLPLATAKRWMSLLAPAASILPSGEKAERYHLPLGS